MHVNQIQEWLNGRKFGIPSSKRRNDVNEYSNVAVQVSIE